MKKRQLRYPVCPKCCYNLSDTPISESGAFTCSECGTQVDIETAVKTPTYIGYLPIPTLIVTLPPTAVNIAGYIFLRIQNHSPQSDLYGTLFVFSSFLSLLWILLTPLYYALRVAMWDGPNDWNHSIGTYFILLFTSLLLFAPFFVYNWIIALMILLGSIA